VIIVEWFQPQSHSIPTLAELMLSLVITLYLLSIPDKSKDGWRITVQYILFTAIYTATFINTSSRQAPWNGEVERIQFIILALLITYNLWFAYTYRHNPFKKEMRLVLGILIGLYGISIYFDKAGIAWTFPLFLLAPVWIITVFVRKAVWAAGSAAKEVNLLATQAASVPLNTGPAAIRELRHPTNRESKAYRDFALCYVIYFLISVDASLGNLGILSDWWYAHVQVLIFLYIILLLLTYINHAAESTSFLAKLVGVFLCLSLILLGLQGFLLNKIGTPAEVNQTAINILVLFIPIVTVVIVVGVPIFFRSNLLRPLHRVLTGVQQVNSGDLNVEVLVEVRDEVGTLAESFNRMAASLRAYSLEMESMVSQRTMELHQQKEELQHTLEHLKASQAKLKEHDELKTRFFDNITHEFRTPLTLILAPVERLLEQQSESPTSRQDLEVIHRNARQLLGLINQLLELAKLEAGYLLVNPQPGDLGRFIGELVQGYIPIARQAELSLTYGHNLKGRYAFDANKIGQIAYNLLVNAVKFTPKGGQIAIFLSATPPGSLYQGKKSEVVLTVRDTGIGILPENLAFIFNRFYQIDLSANQSQPGSGIGLSLVKELTELMEGQVMVVSSMGSGTTFTVQIPLLPVEGEVLNPEDPVVAASDVDQAISCLAPGTEIVAPDAALLLLVEDNAELKAFMARELSKSYRVLTAGNGREGLEISLREIPDVVISDVMMPEVDGYSLCKILKSNPQTNHIAVVLLTARTSYERQMEGLSYGADDYLTKPFHLAELQLRLQNLLGRQQKLREFYQQQFARPETSLVKQAIQDVFLHKLYGIIEQNMDNSQFGAEMLAGQVAMSLRTLNRKLSMLTGIGPAKFIRSYRLKKAAQLLLAGQSVAETAYQVGFESPSYFATAFKEVYQQSPSDFVEN
jgi:signal transduction histidine kinase/CheY-like chemotaxis protein/AraC-like DNA-binding protein